MNKDRDVQVFSDRGHKTSLNERNERVEHKIKGINLINFFKIVIPIIPKNGAKLILLLVL